MAPGRTIAEAIRVACEGLAGDLMHWVDAEPQALREYITTWVLDYGRACGVVLDVDRDIKPEIDSMVAKVRARIRRNWPAV